MDRLITDNISNRIKEALHRQIFGNMFDGSKLKPSQTKDFVSINATNEDPGDEPLLSQ